MRVDKDGKLDIWAIKDFKILEEFGWNVEDMATAIRELREEMEENERKMGGEIEKLETQLQ